MCTSVAFRNKTLYFGRTLDNEFSYNEQVVITPRNYKLNFKHLEPIANHNAMIGMAFVCENYPLYYDAMNEKGLCIAGLNFTGYAKYNSVDDSKTNIAQFEFVPYLLAKCDTVEDVRKELENMNITDSSFNDNLPRAELHWMIADDKQSITVECVKEGMKVYDNPVGVMANNPEFDDHLFNLNNYMNLTNKQPQNNFCDNLNLNKYCRGIGAFGLPGDLTSTSRFVRASFVNMNAYKPCNENENISQFFHIIGSVEQQKGCSDLGDDKYETTIYTSCMDTNNGIYYYTTYNNHQISGVSMFNANLDADELIAFDLLKNENINMQN